MVLCHCLEKSSTKPHSQREAQALSHSFVAACSWGAFRCLLHLPLEPVEVVGLPWGMWGACGRERGCGVAHATGHLLPVPFWTGKCFRHLAGQQLDPSAWLKTLLQKLPQVQRQGQETLGLQCDQNDNAGLSLF